eukprot:2008352-Pleurochrysis_carterae.AAC.2
MLIRSEGKNDKHGALCEGKNATGPSAPTVLVTSIRRPEASRYKDEFARGSPRRRRKAQMRGLGALSREGGGTIDVRSGRRTRGGRHCRHRRRRRRRQSGGKRRRRARKL